MSAEARSGVTASGPAGSADAVSGAAEALA